MTHILSNYMFFNPLYWLKLCLLFITEICRFLINQLLCLPRKLYACTKKVLLDNTSQFLSTQKLPKLKIHGRVGWVLTMKTYLN